VENFHHVADNPNRSVKHVARYNERNADFNVKKKTIAAALLKTAFRI
jgi:hypothetical protein